MSKLRVFLLVVAVVAGTVVLLAVGSYYSAKTPAGQALLRDFLVAQNKAAFVSQTPAAATSTTPATPPSILLIPKSYATQDYFLAVNNVLQDLFAINAVNTQLGPILDTLNRHVLSCSFTGFYEAMGQAHQLANKNQTLVSQLVFHLAALAAANTQTKDAITKVDTDMLITKGSMLTASLQTYSSSLNGLLGGDTPTSAQIAEFQSQVNAATGASQAFADALKPLMTHIVDKLTELLKAAQSAASSTPVKK